MAGWMKIESEGGKKVGEVEWMHSSLVLEEGETCSMQPQHQRLVLFLFCYTLAVCNLGENFTYKKTNETKRSRLFSSWQRMLMVGSGAVNVTVLKRGTPERSSFEFGSSLTDSCVTEENRVIKHRTVLGRGLGPEMGRDGNRCGKQMKRFTVRSMMQIQSQIFYLLNVSCNNEIKRAMKQSVSLLDYFLTFKNVESINLWTKSLSLLDKI